MTVNPQDVLNLIAAAPAVRPMFLRWARAAAKGKELPASFSVKGIDAAARRALEHVLHTISGCSPDGTVYGTMLPPLREPSAWLEVAAALGVTTAKAPAETAEQFLLRLRWLMPEARLVLDDLEVQPEVVRYLRDEANRANWKTLFLNVFRLSQHPSGQLVTLSQLGSDWFNDSKILRAGPLRRQLMLIIATLAHIDSYEENDVFASLGIEANPYTSAVTVFAPFTFWFEDGTSFDFPYRLYERGLVCQLPAETVGKIKRLEWLGEDKRIATSENAAPLTQFVSARRPVLYTEGYPDFAVQAFMRRLAEQGVVAEHWGDADLDGLRIAAQVQANMPVSRVVASSILARPNGLAGIPLTSTQRRRLAHFLGLHSSSPLVDDVRRILEGDCWYEQETFPFERGETA